ncbi:hypothetical protein BH11BAC4_BH11BAC4_07800 [soil metagenome]
MFGNLFGKKEDDAVDHVFKDRAYMSCRAKMKAIATLAKNDEVFIFIAWFDDTAKQFRSYFAENGIGEDRIVEAQQFHTHQLTKQKPVFVEHYPLHSKEKTFVSGWDQKNILVYSAMDEPLFKHFGSEKIIPMMKLMGMKEEEVIEHNMVSKSIIKGQQKIEEQVTLEQNASSQAAWMERNLK